MQSGLCSGWVQIVFHMWFINISVHADFLSSHVIVRVRSTFSFININLMWKNWCLNWPHNSSIYGTNSDQLYISIHDESHGNNLPYLKCYNCLAELYNISLNIKIFTRSAVLTLENMADTPDSLLGMVCRHNFIAFSFIYLDCMTINSLITIPESSIYSLVQQSFKHQNIMTASHEALLEIVNRYYIRVTIFSMLLWNCWIP